MIIGKVNVEVESIVDSVNSVEFENVIQSVNEPDNLDHTVIDFDFESHYDRPPVDILKINLGSADIPRFNCANHKLNVTVRGAITVHVDLTEKLKTLKKSNSSIRRSVALNCAFKAEKCKLRLENLTRWSSAYLMLLSVLRAYNKDMFDGQNPCPLAKEDIEIYLQILKPAYILSQQFQYNHSSIAEVIPNIKHLIFHLRQMEPPENEKKLCKYLVTALHEKFNYELNSNVYKVIKKFNI